MSGSAAASGPHFIVIGAQRAGTTWLHRVLQSHSSLWLAPVKELHYFDKPEVKRTLLDPNERLRLGLRRLLAPDIWTLRFSLGWRDDDWYADLFRAARNKGLIAGEVTPAYATLGEDVYRRIALMNDEIKLIFIMRDPVERAWSAVNNALKKGRVEGTFTVEKAVARARSVGSSARSAYMQTIRTLETVFDGSQLHYCFFDDLRERPEELVTSVLSFLGAPLGNVHAYLPSEPINSAAGAKPIPTTFQRELAKDYLPMLAELCRRFDGPPHRWRARYEALLGVRPKPIPAG